MKKIVLSFAFLAIIFTATAQKSCLLEGFFTYPSIDSCNICYFDEPEVFNNENPYIVEWNFGDGQTSTELYPVHECTSSGAYEVCITITDEADSNCFYVYCDSVFIYEDISVIISPSLPDSSHITYTTTVTGGSGKYDYQWNFDLQGSYYTAQGPWPEMSYTYAEPVGNKIAMLMVEDINSYGCTTTGYDTSETFNPATCRINPFFTFAPTEMDNTFEFIANTDPVDTSFVYNWDMGDGTVFNDAGDYINYTYPGTGEYTVVLEVIDSKTPSCSRIFSQNIVIDDNVTTSIVYNKKSDFGYEFLVDSISGGSGEFDFQWDINGMFYYKEHFYHTFADTGDHSIYLQVTDMVYNKTYDYYDNVYVEAGNPCDIYVDFSYWQDTTMTATEVSFDAFVTNVDFFDLEWNFGDGTTDSVQYPFHEFLDTGVYWVCVTAYDQNDSTCNTTYCDSVYVGVSPPCEIYVDYQPYPDQQNNLQFDFEAFVYDNHGPYTIEWDFGDGTTDYGDYVTHLFPDTSTYLVCAKVIEDDDTTCQSVFCDSVQTGLPPCEIWADFIEYADSANPLGINFEATVYNSSDYSVDWSFSDGGISTGENTYYEFADSGIYHVCVTVTDNQIPECSSVFCKDVYVGIDPPCEISIHYQKYVNPENSLQYDFEAYVYGNHSPYSIIWDFNDGTPQDFGEYVTHTFPDTSTYWVCVTVIEDDDSTCQASFCDSVQTGLPPCEIWTDFIEYADSANPLGINFEASIYNSSDYIVDWNFGDGGVSSGENTYYEFADSGIYNVCVTVTDTQIPECSSTFCKDVYVGVDPPCEIYIDFQNYPYADSTLSKDFEAYVSGNNGPYSVFWDFGDGGNAAGEYVYHQFPDTAVYYVCATVTEDDDSTCQATFCDSVQTGLPPCEIWTDFIEYADSANPLGINFEASVYNSSDYSVDWDFSDGGISTGENTYYEFADSGIYHVCVTVTDNQIPECSSVFCKDVYVGVDPPCEIYVDYQKFTNPDSTLQYDFEAYVSGNNDTYTVKWDFGDGTFGDGEYVTHTFPDTSTYWVCVSVREDSDTTCQSTFCDSVQTGLPPCEIWADFIEYADSANPLGINFEASVYNSSDYTVDWNFGDGGVSSDENTYYEFADSGIYNVCVTVTDNQIPECSSVFCKDVYVGIDLPCEIYIDYQKYANPDTTLQYDFEAYVSGNHSPYSIVWDFNDGTPQDFGEYVTHSFPDTSTYWVCATVIEDDDSTCQASFCDSVQTGLPPCEVWADFIEYADSANPLGINFEASVYNSTDYTLEWDFGDETFGNGDMPYHEYADSGVYFVCVTVTDNQNPECSNTFCKDVYVGVEPPCNIYVEYTPSPDTTNNSLWVNFQADVYENNGPYEVEWDFGDGYTDFGDFVNHGFPASGYYEVCVTVTETDDFTCFYTYCDSIYVEAPPCDIVVDYVFIQDSLDNLSFEFQANVSGTSDTYTVEWDFGDSTYDYGETVYYTFPDTGTFQVCVKAIEDQNPDCFATYCSDIIVEPLPCDITMYYTVSQDSLNNLGYNFSANVMNNNGSYTVEWDFGDSTYDSGENVYHMFPDTGIYYICATVIEDMNPQCSYTICDTLFIDPPPCNIALAYTVAADTTNNLGFSFQTNVNGNNGTYTVEWDFGDGTFDTGEWIYHQFPSTGSYYVCATVTEDDNPSCSFTYCDSIIVEEPPCNIMVDFTYQTYPLAADFNAFVTGNNGTYTVEWDFGDGTTEIGEFIYHEYQTAGDYYVCATVTEDSDSACSFTYCNSVTILPECNIEVMYNFYPLGGLEYTFQSLVNNSNDYIIDWNFGDGTTQVGDTVAHIFPSEGMYNICVTATDALDSNCMDEFCAFVFIQNNTDTCNVHAFFNYNIDSTGFTVQFNNYSVGDITNYYWYFGDGGYSEDENPLYTYSYPGGYDVCLDVYDSVNDCWDSYCTMVNIGGVQNCVAEFSGVPDSIGLGYSFINNSSGNFNEVFWEFDDGTTSNEFEPYHEFPAPGFYTVCLNIFDTLSGCQDNVCHNILVGQDSNSCSANFTFNYNQSTNTFQFVPDIIGNITHVNWDFGDGTQSTQWQPSHQYAQNGSYTVCLSIYSNITGCQANICKEVQYGTTSCNANYTFYVNNNQNKAFFNNTSTGNIAGYFWDFGDGYSSTVASPNHVYNSPGNYWVGLSIYNDTTGCFDYIEKQVNISGGGACLVNYNYFVDSLTVHFNSNTSNNISNYFWDFGDGNTSNDSTPTHTYTNPGIYHVCLDAYDANGNCSDFVCKEIIVGSVECNANFSVYIDSVSNTAHFNNQSTGMYTQSYWEFGDGNFSFNEDPVYTYPAPGYYVASLSVWNQATGCMDYYQKLVLVGNSNLDCEADFSSNVNNQTNTVTFINHSIGQNIVGYLWNFGDETISMEEEPVHVYPEPGIYDVCLSIWNASGQCYNTGYKTVYVGESQTNCNAQFVYTMDASSNTVTFNENSTGNPTEFLWDFGDGNTSIEQDPSHTYTEDSIYLVHLEVSNASGCYDDYYDLININYGGGLFGSFGYVVDTSDTKGHPVDYKSATYGEPARSTWDFGDGEMDSSAYNVRHYYDSTGTYYVCFTISDHITGQSHTSCKWVDVRDSTQGILDLSMSEIAWINYPNPFTDKLNIHYNLPARSQVSVMVYDMYGNTVDKLYTKMQDKGQHVYVWKPNKLVKGLYYIYLKINDDIFVKKIIRMN